MRNSRCLIVLGLVVLGLAGILRAELKPTTLDKPLQVTVSTEGAERIIGHLVRYDKDTLVIKLGGGAERKLKWTNLTSASRYSLRSQLIDKKKASDWIELAELAMTEELPDQARVAVNRAATIDPKTRLRGEAILRGQSATTQGSGGTTTRPGGAEVAGQQQQQPSKVVHYEKSTPEQDAQAIEVAQKVAQDVGNQLKIKLTEFQTAHFIVFTDWDPREYNFLKKNLERAYSAVSKEFNIPDRDNVFVGKLPVFMFAKQDDFRKYTAAIEGFNSPQGLLGFYRGHSDGGGHLVMWKPDVNRHGGNLRLAEEKWAYTLTHEFTHAFVARYRTNRMVPRWMNEGLAEVIASRQFPDDAAYPFARQMAGARFDFQALFDDKKMPGGEMYPVMRTMVEALLQDNYKAFLAMFNDIKDGMKPVDALQKHYKADYKQFEQAWRRYAQRL